ncbi:Cyclic nucleotide-binding domain [Sulfitobacter marinus]|uniref:Cyclic nucleotide-binding domain n=1 Tax=Sulfitobacter marinus TaxID=394264 RepID=A0A1I6QS19_9RHOB|nr:cyclic nucleotide-binding domain-containing protein [Sulfitobacter marinus]SFS55184.1 Cyclic nucleotide-binding domain [Sulfitobacter marinus]
MIRKHEWRAAFPDLAGISDDVSDQLDRHARLITRAQGAAISGADNVTDNLLLVVTGTVRVQQYSPMGRKIAMYHIHSGESCVLTSACLLAYRGRAVQAVAETDVEAVLIPCNVFDALMLESKAFRAFVFASYSKHLSELMGSGPAQSPAGPHIRIH